MATLTLPKTFINLVSSGAAVSAYSGDDRADDFEVPGESRMYAGGRRRSIVGAGTIATYPFTLQLVPDADVATLRAWAGQLVQVRDNLGRRVFGVYRKVPATWLGKGSPVLWTVALAVDVLTFDEAV